MTMYTNSSYKNVEQYLTSLAFLAHSLNLPTTEYWSKEAKKMNLNYGDVDLCDEHTGISS